MAHQKKRDFYTSTSIEKTLIDTLSNSKNPSPQDLIISYSSALVKILNELESSGLNLLNARKAIFQSLKNNNISAYINAACELSAVYYFKKNFPQHFQYQVINPNSALGNVPKNFDFSFGSEKLTFNVEVKSISKTTLKDSVGVKAFLPKDTANYLYQAGMRFDNSCVAAIGRALKEANQQLFRHKDGIGVVLFCCNDLDIYADVIENFVGEFGLIRFPENHINHENPEKSLVPSLNSLENIDAVVVCNLGFGHFGLTDTECITSSYKNKNVKFKDGDQPWQYERSMPAGIIVKNNLPIEVIDTFNRLFLSHSHFISSLRETAGGTEFAIFEAYNKIMKKIDFYEDVKRDD